MRYDSAERDALYEELEPVVEVLHLSEANGWALAAALRKHAKDVEEIQAAIDSDRAEMEMDD